MKKSVQETCPQQRRPTTHTQAPDILSAVRIESPLPSHVNKMNRSKETVISACGGRLVEVNLSVLFPNCPRNRRAPAGVTLVLRSDHSEPGVVVKPFVYTSCPRALSAFRTRKTTKRNAQPFFTAVAARILVSSWSRFIGCLRVYGTEGLRRAVLHLFVRIIQ